MSVRCDVCGHEVYPYILGTAIIPFQGIDIYVANVPAYRCAHCGTTNRIVGGNQVFEDAEYAYELGYGAIEYGSAKSAGRCSDAAQHLLPLPSVWRQGIWTQPQRSSSGLQGSSYRASLEDVLDPTDRLL